MREISDIANDILLRNQQSVIFTLTEVYDLFGTTDPDEIHDTIAEMINLELMTERGNLRVFNAISGRLRDEDSALRVSVNPEIIM